MKPWADPPPNTVADNKCDTNADTFCLGIFFFIFNATFRTADVYAYDTSIKPIDNVPIESAATAYDDPVTGTTYILVFHESLYYGGKLDHSLINPNQIRAYGIPLWDNPYDHKRTLSIDVDLSFHIPLCAYDGTKDGFRSRVPTPDELQSYEHISMTCLHPWNPSDVIMVQAMDQGGSRPWKHRLASMNTFVDAREYLNADSDDALLDSIDPSLTHTAERLWKKHRASQVDVVFDQNDTTRRRTFVSDEQHSKVSAEMIAERYGIGPVRAQKTLRVTTQRGVGSAILPISRRYRADRVFGVKKLNGTFSTYTAYGKLRSLRSKVGAQIN